MLTQTQITSYLQRISVEAPGTLTPEALQKLTRAHLMAVPFENLQVVQGQIPSLETGDLFEKVVVQHRGGYCFELNKLFCSLLRGLGFSCRGIAARVIHRRQEPCAISHRATLVTIEGKRYFCDVGFGGAGPKGILCLEETGIQTAAGENFRITEDPDGYVISIVKDTPEPVLRFRDEPWLDVDFLTLNRYYATYPGSPFRSRRILYRCTETGWVNLTDNLLTQLSPAGIVSRQLREDEISGCIRSLFSLEICN